MIKAVVFDFDGLIIDTEYALYEAFTEILGEEVEIPIHVYGSYIGTDSHALFDYLLSLANGAITLEQLKENSVKIHRERLENIVTRPGVEAYLKEAKKLGLKIGLATSSSRAWATYYLEKVNLLHYFDVLQTRDDVEEVKPNPALYRNVVEYFGVDPAKVIAFEDSVNGSKAAIGAGLNCVIVPNRVTELLPFEKHALRLTSMEECGLSEVISRVSK